MSHLSNYQITPKERALLLQIKAEPEKFLLQKTLWDFGIWASAYDYAVNYFAKEKYISILPDGMNDYAEQKYLNGMKTVMNWCTIILREVTKGDEAAAWEMGWQFIDCCLQYRDCVPLTGWTPHPDADMTVPQYDGEETRDLNEEERRFMSSVKTRPGMYGGNGKFTSLAVFFRGFCSGMERSGHGGEFILVPRAFDAYLKVKFPHVDGADFADVIHAVQPDDEQAMSLFWELFDEYLESRGYAGISEFVRFTDSDFRLLQKGYDFHLCNLLASSFAEVFNAAPWNDDWDHAQAFERIRNLMETPRFDGAAVIRDGKAVAAILGRGEQYYDGVVFQIIEFWVAKDLQRQGIGRRLLADFTAHLKEQGIRRVFLLTMRGDATEGFYQKQGFVMQEGMCLMEHDLDTSHRKEL